GGIEFYSAYGNETPLEEVKPAKPAEPAKPAVNEPGKPAPAAEPDAAADMKSLLASVAELNAKVTNMDKSYVRLEKLPEYRGEMLGATIRLAHEVGLVTANHQKEFGEPLDMDAFDKFIADSKKEGAAYPTVTAAYNAMVSEKRIEKKIADGVAEGVKQK